MASKYPSTSASEQDVHEEADATVDVVHPPVALPHRRDVEDLAVVVALPHGDEPVWSR